MKEGKWDGKFLDAKIEQMVRRTDHLGDLLKIGVTVEQAVREVKGRAEGLRTFGERYVSKTPKVSARLNTRSALLTLSFEPRKTLL